MSTEAVVDELVEIHDVHIQRATETRAAGERIMSDWHVAFAAGVMCAIDMIRHGDDESRPAQREAEQGGEVER